MLSRNAFNAMLKTLEEPPAHVKFILATTDPQKIPVTVLSRCLQFNLKLIPQQQIRARLQHILVAESVHFEPAALLLIARAAQGSLRDALSLLDQAIAHGGGGVTAESARAMLGAVGQDHLHALLRALAERDGAALLAEADHMAERSLSFDAALQDLASLLHRLALVQTVPDTIGEDDPDHAMLDELAAGIAPDDLQLYYQIAIQGRSDLGLAPDEYAGFTMTLLRMLAFAPAEQGVPAAAVRPGPRTEPVAPAVESKKNPGDAAWPELVEQLGLSAMTLELAKHSELVARDESRIELRIAQTHQQLLDGPYQERLKAALEKHLGVKLRLVVKVADNAGGSPAAIAGREKQRQHAQAAAAIGQDPFVRELLDNFDGRVVDSSIKPVQ